MKAQEFLDRFVRETEHLLEAGIREFPDFRESVQVLTALGATTDEFVLDVLTANKDRAHVVINALANDARKTMRLAKMNSADRIAELKKL